jgi:hypothetical protein
MPPPHERQPDPELEMAMNHILLKLSADLRDVSSGLGAHAKYRISFILIMAL